MQHVAAAGVGGGACLEQLEEFGCVPLQAAGRCGQGGG